MIPSIGSLEDQREDYDNLSETSTGTPEEEKEKAVLKRAFNQMDKINSMLSFIIGRVGQFLQG